MKRVAILGLLVAVGCGDDTLTGSDSREAFALGNNLIHEVHVVSFLRDRAPAPFDYTYECEEGGQVLMTNTASEFNRTDPVDMFHEVRDCGWNGSVMDGQLDFLNVLECPGNGFEFDIQGTLTFTGEIEGTCVFDSREQCDGTFTTLECSEG